MSKIDIDKFVVSLLNSSEIANKDKKIIHHALGDQGLRIKDGKIVSIEPKQEPTSQAPHRENWDEIKQAEQDTPKLTEFEDELSAIVGVGIRRYCREKGYDTPHFVGLCFGDSIARECSKELLSIARKEIIESINTEAMVEVVKKDMEDNPLGIMASLSIPGAYRMGINDAKNIIATKG